MSEHSPLPWRIDIGKDCDGNPQVWHVLDAEGRFVITTDCGFYTRFEGDYDLIVNAVNSIDRLRKVNEELVKALRKIAESYTDNPKEDCRGCDFGPHQSPTHHPECDYLVAKQALQSSESDK